MIKHVCLINFNEQYHPENLQSIIDAYKALPALIPEIHSFEVSADAGLLDGNADLVVFGEFANSEDFRVYSVHYAHTDVIFPVLGHLMQSYSTAQYTLD
tara:strand:+ start:844 stop:1140 length:297 start_codon:yes stop_codon:yes gene_type:complete